MALLSLSSLEEWGKTRRGKLTVLVGHQREPGCRCSPLHCCCWKEPACYRLNHGLMVRKMPSALSLRRSRKPVLLRASS
jgi:hypothetical protein